MAARLARYPSSSPSQPPISAAKTEHAVAAKTAIRACARARFESNRLARLTSYPKRYLADCALALNLADLSDSDLGNPQVLGPYFESYLAQQLRPQVDRVGGSLSHLRTGSQEREVDLVIQAKGQLIGVEAKLARQIDPRDTKHLTWLRDEMGDRFAAGFVVYTGGDVHALGDRLWALHITFLTDVHPDE